MMIMIYDLCTDVQMQPFELFAVFANPFLFIVFGLYWLSSTLAKYVASRNKQS